MTSKSAVFARARIAKGLCPRCGEPNPDTYRLCSDCRKDAARDAKELRDRYRREGRCTTCGGRRHGKKYLRCFRCRTVNKARLKKSYKRRRKYGLCVQCGDPCPGARCTACTTNKD